MELDAALALFEEGVARLRAARERLVAAEVKVQAVLEEAAATSGSPISMAEAAARPARRISWPRPAT